MNTTTTTTTTTTVLGISLDAHDAAMVAQWSGSTAMDEL
jgi:hypothetical protein